MFISQLSQALPQQPPQDLRTLQWAIIVFLIVILGAGTKIFWSILLKNRKDLEAREAECKAELATKEAERKEQIAAQETKYEAREAALRLEIAQGNERLLEAYKENVLVLQNVGDALRTTERTFAPLLEARDKET